MSVCRFYLLAILSTILLVGIGPLSAQESVPVDGSLDGGEGVFPEEREWPPLPSWTLPELERIRSGQLELGSALFEDGPENLIYEELFDNLPKPIEQNPFPLEDELYPTTIEDEFLDNYFAGRPATYLVDPQGMLSMQEQKDRQSFLEYHAGDSQIDLYVYVFDQKQQVPPEGEIKGVFQRHFSRGQGLTALIYYFVGAPERSLMVMSPQVGKVVPPTAIKGALIYAKQKAQAKSEPASQLESFSTALSIRLYWMEQELAKQAGGGEIAEDGSGELTVVKADEEAVKVEEKRRIALSAVICAVVALLAVAVGFGWWKARQRKVFFFPETEVKPLLAAPHAAGVGAVIHFGNATLPPSVQREQVPDYLRRM